MAKKKKNKDYCLHCVWVDAITTKFPKYKGGMETSEDRDILNEITNSAVAIASQAMAMVPEDKKAVFLADIAKYSERVDVRRKIMGGILGGLVGGEPKVMTLEEVKAMLEGLNQPKN